MDYIENYVAFQRLRKEEKLIVTFQNEDIEMGLQIAPLLLVVLIENAFKFVSNFPEKENKISINIFTKEKVLYSSFSNTKEVRQNVMHTNSNGIGLANLKRRLELLYTHKHELTTHIENEIYATNLSIDLA
jgi:LytS/YehU family sensor histidine kinase